MATITLPTTPHFYRHGFGTEEYSPLTMDCANKRHHHRPLSLDLSSLMHFTGPGRLKRRQCLMKHRRCGSASSAPGGTFTIPPMGLLSANHQDTDVVVVEAIHPLLRKPLADIIHNSGGAFVKKPQSCEARRKARLQRQEEKQVDTSREAQDLQVSERIESTTCLSLDLSSLPPALNTTTQTSRTTNRQRRIRRASTGEAAFKPVQTLFRTVTSAVESFQQRHRRASTQRRISETLLTLRAASELKQQQQEGTTVETPRGHLSDVGSVLFSPLSPLFSEQQQPQQSQQQQQQQQQPKPLVLKHSTTPEISISIIEKEQPYLVPIVPEAPELLSSNPRLLSLDMFQQLFDEGIPDCLRMHQWERIFSIDRDGDSFQTMLNHCRAYRHTILVVKTSTGHILGGFASDPWQEQDGFSERHSYYGTGLSFLFANHPLLEAGVDPQRKESKPLMLFKWTGDNDFCQICDLDKKVIAMGGSGAFGLILEDDFYVGSTDRCGTFGNPPLTPDKDGTFCVESMEIYGLVPYGGLFSSGLSPTCVAQVFDPRKSNAAGVMNQGSFGQFLRT